MTIFLADGSPLDNLKDVALKAGVDQAHIGAQIIVFLFVGFMLKTFAFGPILEVMERRRKLIEEGLANAEKVKRELKEAEESRKSIVQKANAQATELIAEATKAAAAQKEIIVQRAEEQAKEIIAEARQEAHRERDRVRQDLRKEVASLVLLTTEQVAGKVLSSDDQQRLQDETRTRLAASSN